MQEKNIRDIKAQLITYILNTRIGDPGSNRLDFSVEDYLTYYEDFELYSEVVLEKLHTTGRDHYVRLELDDRDDDKKREAMIRYLRSFLIHPAVLYLNINVAAYTREHDTIFHDVIHAKDVVSLPLLSINITRQAVRDETYLLAFIKRLAGLDKILAIEFNVETCRYTENQWDMLFNAFRELIVNPGSMQYLGINLRNANFKKNVAAFSEFCKSFDRSVSSCNVYLECDIHNFNEENKVFFLDTVQRHYNVFFKSPVSYLANWKEDDVRLVNLCFQRNQWIYSYPRHKQDIIASFNTKIQKFQISTTLPCYQPQSLGFFAARKLSSQSCCFLMMLRVPECEDIKNHNVNHYIASSVGLYYYDCKHKKIEKINFREGKGFQDFQKIKINRNGSPYILNKQQLEEITWLTGHRQTGYLPEKVQEIVYISDELNQSGCVIF